ncbi:hypothetical protein LBW46_22105, partial [Ralstonia solanacearum]|uniref:hypothetical protein n=2 Tax=Ralstonia solanacearum TaxID=305 RepID=UPI001CF48C02
MSLDNVVEFKMVNSMPNVYVEPRPKGADGAIQGYVLEFEGDRSVTNKTYKTQEDAIKDAKALGHRPL